MFAAILSLPVSVGLLVWIIKMKKDHPFPKGTILKLLAAGVLSGMIAGAVTILGGLISFISIAGIDTMKQILSDPSSPETVEILKNLTASMQNAEFHLVRMFIREFIFVGFAEEIFKYLFARGVFRRNHAAKTWLDAVLCFSVCAVGFQLSEDLAYSSGSVLTAVMRALTPYHFTFAAVMGYFYGRAKTGGSRINMVYALLVPSFLHTLFDFSIQAMQKEEMYLILVLASALLLFVLTIVMFLKIRKWHKTGELDIELLQY